VDLERVDVQHAAVAEHVDEELGGRADRGDRLVRVVIAQQREVVTVRSS
jgi:hypothetical protein